MKTFILALLAGALALASAGCEGAAVATPPPVTITIGGSSAMGPVLKALTDEYSRQHPSVLFALHGGGSTPVSYTHLTLPTSDLV